MVLFRMALDRSNMKEIYMRIDQYMWWNKRKGTQLVRAKLDWCFENESFYHANGDCCIDTIRTPSSDHHALILFIMDCNTRTSRNKGDWTIYITMVVA